MAFFQSRLLLLLLSLVSSFSIANAMISDGPYLPNKAIRMMRRRINPGIISNADDSFMELSPPVVGDSQTFSSDSGASHSDNNSYKEKKDLFTASFPIEKSNFDDRKYASGVLENGLEYLAVSDPATNAAAAAIDVKVGSFDDPPDLLGLAHFLEHMLFMGSKKYPQEDEYSSFLASHQGASNAFTASEHTNFYFAVNPSDLHASLDRFSRFFVDPLINRDSMEREANAVNSEHAKNIQADIWREEQVLKSLARKSHPYSRFSTGNLETLMSNSNRTLAGLRELHKNYYCARNMKLAIVGKESTKELQDLVTALFQQVPSKCARSSSPSSNDDSSSPPPLRGSNGGKRTTEMSSELVTFDSPFNDDQTSSSSTRQDSMTRNCSSCSSSSTSSSSSSYSFVCVQAVSDRRLLRVSWPIPPQHRTYWRSKSVQYLERLLGQETPGSIFQVLRSRDYANELTTECDTYDSFELFTIVVSLTPKGGENIEDILDHIYSYVVLILSSNDGITNWRHKEYGDLANLDFLFAAKESPDDMASNIAAKLHVYPPKSVLKGPFQWEAFDPDRIRNLLTSYINPSNAITMLVSPKEAAATNNTADKSNNRTTIEYDQVEPWYGVKYAVKPFSMNVQSKLEVISERIKKIQQQQQQQQQLQGVTIGDKDVVNDEGLETQLPAAAAQIMLPERNKFIPMDTSLAPSSFISKMMINKYPSYDFPLLIRDDWEKTTQNTKKGDGVVEQTNNDAPKKQSSIISSSSLSEGQSLDQINKIKNGKEKKEEEEEMGETAERSENEGMVRAWWLQDTRYKKPHVNMILGVLTSLEDVNDLRMQSIALLYEEMFNDIFAELSYAASDAGFSASVSVLPWSIQVELHGYRSGMRRFLELFLQNFFGSAMKSSSSEPKSTTASSHYFSADRFQVIKDRTLRYYQNMKYQQPIKYCGQIMRSILREGYSLWPEHLEALRKVQFGDVVGFMKRVLRDASMEVLMHGSITLDDASDLLSALTTHVNFKTVSHRSTRPHPQARRILDISQTNMQYTTTTSPREEGQTNNNTSTYTTTSSSRRRSSSSSISIRGAQKQQQQQQRWSIIGEGQDANNLNSAATAYYQLGLEEDFEYSRVLVSILESIAHQAAFHQLRTIEQLGYIASATSDSSNHVLGLIVQVQSAAKPAHILADRIHSFITNNLTDIIDNMSNDEFKTMIEAQIESLSKQPTNMGGVTEEVWDQIMSKQYEFGRRINEINNLRKVAERGKDALLKFYHTLINKNNPYLSVEISKKTNSSSAELKDNSESGMSSIPTAAVFSSSPAIPSVASPSSSSHNKMMNTTSQTHQTSYLPVRENPLSSLPFLHIPASSSAFKAIKGNATLFPKFALEDIPIDARLLL